MMLANDTELRNTQAKLARLQERYEALRDKPCEDEALRMASLMSLKKLINQFTEEIVRYQIRQPANGQGAEPGERRLMQPSHPE